MKDYAPLATAVTDVKVELICDAYECENVHGKGQEAREPRGIVQAITGDHGEFKMKQRISIHA
jgi:hypothetical protein